LKFEHGLIGVIIFIIGIFPILPSAIAQSSDVPDWLKNNAKWWAEGEISEQEFINSIQFLIDQGIINVGLSTIFQPLPFASNIPQDDDRVQWYVVKLSGGDLRDTHTFYTFGKFEPGEDPTFLKSLRLRGFTTYFVLESLPNKELTKVYEIVSHLINPGRLPQPFDVTIISFTGDGTPLVSSKYNKCNILEYTPYLQDFVFVYQLKGEFESEIRDRTVFQCGGVKIEINPNPLDIDSSKLGMIPNDISRGEKFVVHFFNGDIPEVFSRTFTKFAPPVDTIATPYGTIDTPYVTISSPGNLISSSPQFYLEDQPRIDKQDYYEFISRHVNSVRTPALFDVSVDLITGDNTILQRWNFVKCKVTNYSMEVEISVLRFTYAEQHSGKLNDKTDFECSGNNFRVYETHKIEKLPIKDQNYNRVNSEDFEDLYKKDLPSKNERAEFYTISAYSGEVSVNHTSKEFPIFKGLVQNKGLLIPSQHAKKYEVGFYVEGLPGKEKEDFYNFLARYTNPGKTPEPFNVDVDVFTGDGRIIETLQYRKCSAIDFDWYTQDVIFFYQISGKIEEEIRERYTFYCNDYRIELP
jgi:hypothetical protein